MELSPAYLVIIDISGYTSFVKMHRTALVHAEQIITELMETMLEKRESPLILDKLQGDAAVFYALDDGSPEMATVIVQQVQWFFEAFNSLESELVSCNLCICDACDQIEGLRLKAVLHHGEIILKQMGGGTEIGGADIIQVHRLLKNKVEGDEYILMTRAFHNLAGDVPGLEPHSMQEEYDLGTVDLVVFYPDPERVPPSRPTLRARLAQFGRIEWWGLKRMLLGTPAKAEFRNFS